MASLSLQTVPQGCSDDAVILDPTSGQDVKSFELAPRNGKVSGTLGLFDIIKAGGSVLLDYFAVRPLLRYSASHKG